MFVALDTSHLDRSALNLSDPETGFQKTGLGALSVTNNALKSVTFETSHDPTGPRGPLEQSKSSTLRHSVMVALSSALDWGAHPGVLRRVFVCGSVFVCGRGLRRGSVSRRESKPQGDSKTNPESEVTVR